MQAMQGVRVVLAMLAAAAAAPALAQSSASADASATITIIRGIELVKDADLQFGTCVQPSAAGTVTVALDGTRTTSGVTCVAAPAPAAAAFTITGEGAAAITVTVPASVTLTSGGNSLAVALVNNAPTVIAGSAGSTGTSAFNVGGTASLAAAQATGVYTGTFTVTAAYQ